MTEQGNMEHDEKKPAALFMGGRRAGRTTMLRALRATGDEALHPQQLRALFYGEFSIEGRDADLVKLAGEYYDRTEAYDRTVCTGPKTRDGIMPANHRELAAINRNANLVRAELRERAIAAGFTSDQFKEAMMHRLRRGGDGR